jgi:hypothetical protein
MGVRLGKKFYIGLIKTQPIGGATVKMDAEIFLSHVLLFKTSSSSLIQMGAEQKNPLVKCRVFMALID